MKQLSNWKAVFRAGSRSDRLCYCVTSPTRVHHCRWPRPRHAARLAVPARSWSRDNKNALLRTNMTSSKKPEVDNEPQRRQRSTEPWPRATCKFGWNDYTLDWRCWLGGRKGVRPAKTEWWDVGVVTYLVWGADLHMAQLVPLPLTISRFSKFRLFLPSWFYLTGTGSPG